MWVAQQIIELTLCHFIKCSNGGWGNIKDAFRMGAPTLAPERSEWNVASTLVLLTWLHRCYQSAPPRLAQWVKIFDSFKIAKKKLIFCNFNYDKKKLFLLVPILKMAKNHFCTKRKVFKNNVIFGRFFPCFRSQCLESSKKFFFFTWWWWSGSQMRSPKTGDWFNRWLWQNTSLIGSIKWQSSVFSGEENHFRPRDHIWRMHIFLLLYYFKLHNSLI